MMSFWGVFLVEFFRTGWVCGQNIEIFGGMSREMISGGIIQLILGGNSFLGGEPEFCQFVVFEWGEKEGGGAWSCFFV